MLPVGRRVSLYLVNAVQSWIKMQLSVGLVVTIFLLVTFPAFSAHGAEVDTPSYGNSVAKLPTQIVKRLAEASAPSESGAIGRNKRAYFHVRFQRGMHHVADYGLAIQRCDVVARFLNAVEYSLEQQLSSGDFSLVIPESLELPGTLSTANRASGVAFFASSLGLGVHALETNDWFMNSSDCIELRQQLAQIKPRLMATLEYLIAHQKYLEAADKVAPNRLLFNALAFTTLGKILSHDEALKLGSSFVSKAVKQVHLEDGYFIEGGGFDSSYNAVATALAFRLLLINYRQHDLQQICENAIGWQKGRILSSGNVLTEGNARVRPGNSGESFLGREKDVDVGHVVEAFMLASMTFSDKESETLALKVIRFYETKYRSDKG